MRRLTGVVALLAALACTNDATPDPAPKPTPQALRGSLMYVTQREVRLAAPDGSVRTIGEHFLDASACTWSGDGRYVAWVRDEMSGKRSLHVHEPATGRTGTWSDDRVDGDQLVGTATGFVMAYRKTGERPALIVADPARLLADGKPTIVPLSLRAGSILTAHGSRVLVQQPKRGAAFTGGPSVLYDVTLGGRATPLFTNPRDWPVHHAAFTADGRRLVHSAGDRLSKDRVNQFVVVRDLATGKELDVPMPARPDTRPAATSIVAGADGRIVATLFFAGPDGEDVAREAYVLEGESWRKVAEDVQWAATGPTGAVAAISGDESSGPLTVDGRHLADGVECAAWAPQPA